MVPFLAHFSTSWKELLALSCLHIWKWSWGGWEGRKILATNVPIMDMFPIEWNLSWLKGNTWGKKKNMGVKKALKRWSCLIRDVYVLFTIKWLVLVLQSIGVDSLDWSFIPVKEKAHSLIILKQNYILWKTHYKCLLEILNKGKSCFLLRVQLGVFLRLWK